MVVRPRPSRVPAPPDKKPARCDACLAEGEPLGEPEVHESQKVYLCVDFRACNERMKNAS